MSARPLVQHLVNRRIGFDAHAFAAWPSPLKQTDCPAGDRWSPPLPSIASRRPALWGRGSVRGWIVDPAANRELVFESTLERGMAELLAARRDVSQVIDQPPAVTYVDRTGRSRRHTFDFLAVMQSGTRIAFAVKPSAKVERSGIEDVIHQIRTQLGTGFADRFLLRTEQHITRDRIFNARLILRARKCRDHRAIETVRRLFPNPGTVRIADLVRASGLGAAAFNSVVGLIDEGFLTPVGNARIDYTTPVQTRVAGGQS